MQLIVNLGLSPEQIREAFDKAWERFGAQQTTKVLSFTEVAEQFANHVLDVLDLKENANASSGESDGAEASSASVPESGLRGGAETFDFTAAD